MSEIADPGNRMDDPGVCVDMQPAPASETDMALAPTEPPEPVPPEPVPEPEPDLDLDLVVAGPRSFEEVYRGERGALVRALALALGDPDLATEAVDEAFARAYERWTQVGALERPAGWIYRVALNWA